jgi:tetratricopeptide (TPR) repeat protein
MTFRRPHLLAPLAAFAVTLVVLPALGGGPTEAPALPPDRPGTPQAELPAGASTEQRLAATRSAIRRDAGDAALYATLGDLSYQRGRETADGSWNDRARAAYAAALARDPRNAQATLGLGTLALAEHDFAGGLRYGRRARALEPSSTRPYSAIVDGLIELGRYEEGARALQRFVDLKPSLASYARVSYYRELHGDLDGAVAAMRRAVSAGGGAENVAYVQTLLGGLEFQRGNLRASARAHRAALARMPGYLPASAGLAAVAAARGDVDAAIRRYRAIVATSPVHEYNVGLLEAQLAAGRTADARRTIRTIREQPLERAAGVNTDAELAVFEADHGDARRAVRLGRSAVQAAPSVAAADAYGWALARAGRPQAALEWARRAVRLGTRDPLLLYHAGIAARDAGRAALARRWLARAIELNPRFSPLHAPAARRALDAEGRRPSGVQDS